MAGCLWPGAGGSILAGMSGWADDTSGTGEGRRSAARDGLAAVAIILVTVALIVFVISRLV